MKKRLLWIEDDIYQGMISLLPPLRLSGRYQIDTATDVSEAVYKIQSQEYDGLLVDIRLGPGSDQRWIDWYQTKGGSKKSARLGLALLESLLEPDRARFATECPDWLRPSRIGIFSVEEIEELEEELTMLGISLENYRHKNAYFEAAQIVEFVDSVLSGEHARDESEPIDLKGT